MANLKISRPAADKTPPGPGPSKLKRRWDALRIEARNVFTILRGRPGAFWNETYGSGYWSFLKNRQQRPRHYVVAGLVRDLAPVNAAILEVGCGYAPILDLLPAGEYSYLGIDYSEEVIRQNQASRFEDRVEFRKANFPAENSFGKFDVAIASELLYYFPLSKLAEAFRLLLANLKEGGMLIVTMNKNPKAWLAWRILRAIASPEELVICRNGEGSRWTVCMYRSPKESISKAAS